MVYTGSIRAGPLHTQVGSIKNSACAAQHVQVVWIQQVRGCQSVKSSCQESLTLISMARGKKRATSAGDSGNKRPRWSTCAHTRTSPEIEALDSGRQTENTTLNSPEDVAVASQRENTSPSHQSQSGVNAPPAQVTPQTDGNDTTTPLTREDIPELIQQIVRGLNTQMGSGTQPGTVL